MATKTLFIGAEKDTNYNDWSAVIRVTDRSDGLKRYIFRAPSYDHKLRAEAVAEREWKRLCASWGIQP